LIKFSLRGVKERGAGDGERRLTEGGHEIHAIISQFTEELADDFFPQNFVFFLAFVDVALLTPLPRGDRNLMGLCGEMTRRTFL
jgi:hypothetical protein